MADISTELETIASNQYGEQVLSAVSSALAKTSGGIDITSELYAINNGRYGVDIRDAIHDALVKISEGEGGGEGGNGGSIGHSILNVYGTRFFTIGTATNGSAAGVGSAGMLVIWQNYDNLNTVLQTLVTNGIVGAVEDDNTQQFPKYIIYADSNKTQEIFRMVGRTGGTSNDIQWTFMATSVTGDTISLDTVTGGSGSIAALQIACGYYTNYGVLLTGAPGHWNSSERKWEDYHGFDILITTNQNGNPVFMYTVNSTTTYDPNNIAIDMNTGYIISPFDVAPFSKFSFVSPLERNQTVIAPLFTNCDVKTASYTPNAGRVLACDFTSAVSSLLAVTKTINGSLYYTTGYWALKIGEAP